MLGRTGGRFAGTAALLLWASTARAQATDKPRCAELELSHTLYGVGSSSFTAVLQRQSASLHEQGITLFYADPANCESYGYFRDGSVPNDATLQKKYKYWEAPSSQYSLGQLKECYAPEAEPQFAYLAYPVELCEGAAVAPDTKLFPAVVDSVNVMTDAQSEENAISAEALYRILKFGANASGIAPWIVDEHVYRWGTATTASILLGEAIGVSPEDFVATVFDGTGGATFLSHFFMIGTTSPNTPLTYLTSSAADLNSTPDKLKTLAFQGVGQTCGYYPDSALTARDKRNVRSGLYALWSQGHFVAKVDEADEIVDPDVAALIRTISGQVEDVDAVRRVIEAGNIPLCAMQVTREGLLGPISSSAPPIPCGCYYETVATTDVPAECEACEDDSDCGTARPACNYGFCEAYREEE